MVLAGVVVLGIVAGSLAVSGQQDTGKLRVVPADGKEELAEGESQTIEIFYESPGSDTPNVVEFDLIYDQEVVSIPDDGVSSGGYLSGIPGNNVSNGIVSYGEYVVFDENLGVNPNKPVATIEITPADGADVGDQTDLELTNVLIQPETLGTPKAVNKTITVVSSPKTGSAFTIGDLSPTEDVQPGRQVTLRPTIKNERQQSKSETVAFELGSERRTSELTLAGGESTQLSETLPAPTVPGNVTYNVSTDGDFVTGEITVREATSDDIVEIQDSPTISPTPIDSTLSEHTLNFTVANISADNETDNFTVTLPEEVTVENVVETNVTDANGEPIAVSDDPAEDDDPGRELKFAVNPNSQETAVKTLTVEVDMELSATP
jgi:hypothetical protein